MYVYLNLYLAKFTFYYKYTGKQATFIIKLQDYGIQKSVAVKSNAFVITNFQLLNSALKMRIVSYTGIVMI